MSEQKMHEVTRRIACSACGKEREADLTDILADFIASETVLSDCCDARLVVQSPPDHTTG